MADSFNAPLAKQATVVDAPDADQSLTASLNRLTPDQLDSLVYTRAISPEQANALKESRTSANIRTEQSAMEDQALAAQKIAEPAQYAQDAQHGIDTAENVAMQGTGVAPGFADIQPPLTPMAGQTKGLPSTLETPAQTQAKALEQAVAQDAQMKAQQLVETENVRKVAEQSIKDEARANTVQNKVREDLKTSGSPLMRNIMDGVAIMIGAYSQGLTGNKENPALAAIDKRIEREVAQRKYNAEQEQALRKLAIDAANLQLDKMRAMTDNQLKHMQMAEIGAKIGQLQVDNKKAQQMVNLINKKEYTSDELLSVSGTKEGADLQKMSIPLPFTPGKFARTTTSEAATENLRKYMAETSAIIPEIDSVIALMNSPDFSKFDPKQRYDMQTKLATLAGALRIPITGPGPMTDTERKFLLETLGDPTKIFTLPSWQRTRLQGVRKTIRGRIKMAYRNFGNIDIPDSEDTQQNNKFQTAGFSEEQIQQARENILNKKRP